MSQSGLTTAKEPAKRKAAAGRAASCQKWPKDHAEYKKKNDISEVDLQVPQVRWVLECSGLSTVRCAGFFSLTTICGSIAPVQGLQKLDLPKRELEATLLSFACLRKRLGRAAGTAQRVNQHVGSHSVHVSFDPRTSTPPSCVLLCIIWLGTGTMFIFQFQFRVCSRHVIPSGDSLTRHKWRSFHPCLLPQKRFLYLDKEGVHLNRSPTVVMSLQGLSALELKAAGLTDLSTARAQELAGNAFTMNVAACILLCILIHVLD